MESVNGIGNGSRISGLALSHRDDHIGDNSINASRRAGDTRPSRIPETERDTLFETIPLKTIFLHVTKACNLSCCYCYFSANKVLPNEMTRAEFGRLWGDIVTLRPQKVVFTGGEPLLRKDTLQLIRDMRDADPHHYVFRCLNTNGHSVTQELAEEIVGLADEVRVSLDALPERNDMLRGKGNFDAAVKALEYLHAAGFEPKVLVTVTSVSLPDLAELLLFLIQKGITRVNINLFRSIGRGRGHREWIVQPGEVYVAMQKAQKRCSQDRSVSLQFPDPLRYPNCGVGAFLSILPTGDAFPCHMLMTPEFRCGNVGQQSLTEICHQDSLLGRLRGLGFHQLVRQDKRLAPLTGSDTCLGSVFARTRSLPVWRKTLALLSHN